MRSCGVWSESLYTGEERERLRESDVGKLSSGGRACDDCSSLLAAVCVSRRDLFSAAGGLAPGWLEELLRDWPLPAVWGWLGLCERLVDGGLLWDCG
ncbi:hypothetical protein [Microbulbifer sp. 2205BS26-8]|uniref:hypothetical protein n=1 Tax=Microbulbifer sp. 2205BS26-8 TaxID=3064386 RepID=UPI00274028E1|nr:hypothetical protein [Microbulbifer sp. 2205BS26-8]MDP5209407.1 hypothetical protein [Microbulbifer sp. 2205BS26-8]